MCPRTSGRPLYNFSLAFQPKTLPPTSTPNPRPSTSHHQPLRSSLSPPPNPTRPEPTLRDRPSGWHPPCRAWASGNALADHSPSAPTQWPDHVPRQRDTFSSRRKERAKGPICTGVEVRCKKTAATNSSFHSTITFTTYIYIYSVCGCGSTNWVPFPYPLYSKHRPKPQGMDLLFQPFSYVRALVRFISGA